ncbi:MAG: type I glyceraldehyde-3-phosphate dehydrogenase [Parcubacteria group bacterium]
MAQPKIAINGFGRIGRMFFRHAWDNPDLDIVAINDLGDLDNLAYLLKYDSVYKTFEKEIKTKNGNLIVDGQEIEVLQEREPSKLPWSELGVDIVVEATGAFTTLEKAKAHLHAGAKRVVITAPAKDDITPTATPNVGEDRLSDENVTSNASCTTNAVAPIMAIMSNNPGVKKALLNTIHGYTATQGLIDGPSKKDFRRGRAAAQNIIPSSTGAAIATTKALPNLKGKFDGIAMRVPVITGSIIDVTFIAEKSVSVEDINNIFREKAKSDEWKGILAVTEEPIVSSDIIGNSHGSIIDLSMTRVVDGDLVKVCAWYDNEWGYASMLVKHVKTVAKML